MTSDRVRWCRFDFQKKIAPAPAEAGRPAVATDPKKIAAITGGPLRVSQLSRSSVSAAVSENQSKALPEQEKLSKHRENLKKLPVVVEYLTQTKKIDGTRSRA